MAPLVWVPWVPWVPGNPSIFEQWFQNHEFWKDRTKIYPVFSSKTKRKYVGVGSWDIETAFGNPSFSIPNGATVKGDIPLS